MNEPASMPFSPLQPISVQDRQRLLVLVAAAFILRSPAFVTPVIDEDEAFYAVAARVVNEGGVLYRDAVDLKPPSIMYLYSWSFSVFGDDLRILHVLTTLWVLATAWVIARLLRHLDADADTTWLSAFLYVLFTPTFIPQALATNCEIVMNLPLVASMLFFLKAERARRYPNLFLGGVLCGLAFSVKYQSGILLGVYFFDLLVAQALWTKARSLRAALARSSTVAAGFAVVLATFYGLFRYLGSWNDFYSWGWQYNFTFMNGLTWTFFVDRFFERTPRFVVLWFILWFFAFVAIRKALRRPREVPASRHLLMFWLAGSTVAVCSGGKFFGHYYVQLLPPLVILAAQGLSGWREGSAAHTFADWKKGLVLTAIVLPPMICLGVNWQVELSRMAGEQQFFRRVAGEVRQRTGATDRIFVWGRMPELYYFSQRLPASRFITCNFVVGMTTYNYHDRAARMVDPGRSRAGELLLEDLQRNRPKLILDSSPLDFRQYGKYPIPAFPRLRGFLDENYRLLGNSHGLAVYEARF